MGLKEETTSEVCQLLATLALSLNSNNQKRLNHKTAFGPTRIMEFNASLPIRKIESRLPLLFPYVTLKHAFVWSEGTAQSGRP